MKTKTLSLYSGDRQNEKQLNPPAAPATSSTAAHAPQRARAASAVLLVRVGVAQLLGCGAIAQPHLDVGQVPPI